MALIIWTRDHSVGVDSLDSDHIVIASLINHVEEAKRFGSDEVAVGRILRVLIDQAHGHFRREEELLKEYRYPGLEEHLREHRLLERQLEELHEEYERYMSPEISQEITELLAYWLDDHILQVDMNYKQFLKEAMG